MFINNNFSPFTSCRPPFMKIDSEVKDDEEEAYYTTDIDSFDLNLYQMNLKSNSVGSFSERNCSKEIYKFLHSENLHHLIYNENINVETFDNLSNRKPFASTQPLSKINLKTKYKFQLNKIYKNGKGSYTKTKEILIDEDPRLLNKSRNSIISNDFKQSEKEKSFFDRARVKNTSFQPTHYKSSLKKGVLNLKFEDNVKEIMQVDDSIFNSCHDVYLQKNPSRPQFVEDLFKKYDYQDLDPWKKVQNRTKDKSLCLSVIQDIYNKIKNIFS
jgi:hypothetical protein